MYVGYAICKSEINAVDALYNTLIILSIHHDIMNIPNIIIYCAFIKEKVLSFLIILLILSLYFFFFLANNFCIECCMPRKLKILWILSGRSEHISGIVVILIICAQWFLWYFIIYSDVAYNPRDLLLQYAPAHIFKGLVIIYNKHKENRRNTYGSKAARERFFFWSLFVGVF